MKFSKTVPFILTLRTNLTNKDGMVALPIVGQLAFH